MADSEYQKTQDGGNVVFEVTPATTPKNITALVFGVIWVLVFGGVAYSFRSSGLFMAVVGIAALIVYLGWFKDWRPKAHRSKSTFRVSSSAIETNRRTSRRTTSIG